MQSLFNYIVSFRDDFYTFTTKTTNPMASAFFKLQVKSSNQYLNIPDSSNSNAALAVQSPNPNGDNFLWQASPAPGNPGYFLIMVKSSNQYLNILNGGNQNGTLACQGNNPTTDNFLWQFEESPGNPGYFFIKVKSSGQYLNILDASRQPGANACQGISNTTDNFLWTLPARAVKVTLQVDCANMYQQPAGPVSDAAADAYLRFSDDNRGSTENPHQKSFRSYVNNGSQVTWDANFLPGTSNDYSLTIDDIRYESESDDNIFSKADINGVNGKANAFVLPTAPVLPDGDNESYTVFFTITPTNGTPKQYSVDPKLKINPAT